MSEQKVDSPRPRSWTKVLGLLIAAYLIYQGVLVAVRVHVSERIEQNQGVTFGEFELSTWSGELVRSSDHAGKILVLNFFRSHCVNCRVEAPEIKRLAKVVDPDHCVVLGVMQDSVDGYFPREVSEKTIAELGYEHPILMADQAFVDRFHGSQWKHVTPVTYVFDPARVVVGAYRGHQSFEELASALPESALRSH